MLFVAVIVGGDGAAAEVHPLPHVAVAHIGQMADLGAVSDDGVLHLHEVPHPAVVTDTAVGPDIGEGPHGGVAADGALIDLRGIDGGVLSHDAVPHHGVGADLAAGADGGMAPEDGTRQQGHAGSDGAAGIDIGGGGVYDGDARHAPQQQLTGIRHGGTERRLIRHRAEYRRQRLRLPQTADAAGLRRAVRQRDAALQTGLQRPDLGGVYAAAVLRAVHRHHGAGDYDDLTLCIGQRLLRVSKPSMTSRTSSCHASSHTIKNR